MSEKYIYQNPRSFGAENMQFLLNLLGVTQNFEFTEVHINPYGYLNVIFSYVRPNLEETINDDNVYTVSVFFNNEPNNVSVDLNDAFHTYGTIALDSSISDIIASLKETISRLHFHRLGIPVTKVYVSEDRYGNHMLDSAYETESAYLQSDDDYIFAAQQFGQNECEDYGETVEQSRKFIDELTDNSAYMTVENWERLLTGMNG